MSRLSPVGITLAAALALSACSSGIVGIPAAAPSPGYSIAALLQQVPQSAGIDVDGSMLLSSADLNAASVQSGLQRPPVTASLEEQLDWVLPLTGVPRDGSVATACLLPDAVNGPQLAMHDEFTDEVGWNLWQVDTFIDSALPPADLSVMTGGFDQSSIEAAIGPQTNGYWATAGDDYEADLEKRTVASPLGQPLRMAMANTTLSATTLAVSHSTLDIQRWIAKSGATMADDPGVLAVAQALDGQNIYSASIARSDFGGNGAVLEPFDTVGIGVRIVDGESQLVLVYHHADPATSMANVQILKDLVADGTLQNSGSPVADLVTVADVSSSGNLLIAALGLKDQTPPTVGWQLLFNRDVFFLHS